MTKSAHTYINQYSRRRHQNSSKLLLTHT